MLHISLDFRIGELATDETLGIENGVDRVHRDLILGRVTDETFGVGERHERRGGSVSLVIGNDLRKS